MSLPSLSCVILAGGLGTRLRSVVADVPKPLAHVAGRPFLEIIIAQARHAQVKEVVLCIGYLAEHIEQHFGGGSDFGVPIRYSHEKDLLGTGGALKLAEDLISTEKFWVFNGDSYCGVDFEAMHADHVQRQAVATLAAPQVADRARFGSLELDESNQILAFGEKGQSGPGLINGGIYLMNRTVLTGLPSGQVVSLERDVFPGLCGNGLFAFPANGDFIDIGLPEEWHRAQNLDFLARNAA